MSREVEPDTIGRSDVVAALRETWREGEAISAGSPHDKERALEGSGMRDAAEKIAALLGVPEAEFCAVSRPMTLEQVRVAAGLVPFSDYARAAAAGMAQRHPDVDPQRGSGRTTRMLCEALAAASRGRRVHVVAGRGGRWRRPQLERQALGLARQAGLSLERIRVLSHDQTHELRGLPQGDLVLHDHE